MNPGGSAPPPRTPRRVAKLGRFARQARGERHRDGGSGREPLAAPGGLSAYDKRPAAALRLVDGAEAAVRFGERVAGGGEGVALQGGDDAGRALRFFPCGGGDLFVGVRLFGGWMGEGFLGLFLFFLFLGVSLFFLFRNFFSSSLSRPMYGGCSTPTPLVPLGNEPGEGGISNSLSVVALPSLLWALTPNEYRPGGSPVSGRLTVRLSWTGGSVPSVRWLLGWHDGHSSLIW
jgi:hypothetical protein